MRPSTFRGVLTTTALTTALAAALATTASAFQDVTRVSVDSAGGEGNSDSYFASASADGQLVVFWSYSSNLVAGDTRGYSDVFVHDRRTGTTERVTVDSAGNQANGASQCQGHSPISADGSLVLFSTGATNLDPNDTNGAADLYLRDRVAGTTILVSVDSAGVVGDWHSLEGVITPDGRYVCFSSYATNLVANDGNLRMDVFVRDLATGVTERVSVDSNGFEGDEDSSAPAITPDGRYVVFSSWATNLVTGDTNGVPDVFLRDRLAGTTERVSVSDQGNQGDGDAVRPSISDDGNRIVFDCYATNLVAGDTNLDNDVFVRDRALGTTTRVSVDSAGGEVQGDSWNAAVDAAGRRVVFSSTATALVPGDTNGVADVFLHDLATGATERVSVDSSGAEADGWSEDGAITPDGRVVLFHSRASNLVANDLNDNFDVFARDACSTPSSWANYGAGFPGTHGVPALTAQQLPSFGATLTVDLDNSCGAPTIGLLVVGLQRGSFKTKFGGDLLVVPTLIAPITFSFGSDAFTGAIPDDFDLCGVTVDLQGIEADPGAQFGVSFSQGLELVIGS